MNIVCHALVCEFGLDYERTGLKQPWKYNFCFTGHTADSPTGRFRANGKTGIEECLYWLDELEAVHVVLLNERSELLWNTDDGIVEGAEMPKYLKKMLEGWKDDRKRVR